MRNKGFILIEMMIYAGLFSILMSGLIVTAYQLSSSSNSIESKVIVQEEMNFSLKKLDWILTGASNIDVVSNVLKVTQDSGVFNIKLIDDWLAFCKGSCTSDDDFSPLTTENVTVESLTLTKIHTDPLGISLKLKMNGIVTDYVKYLRI